MGKMGIMTNSRSTLGSVIRRLRDSKGWTLREMSEHTGIPLSTLSKVEHNRLTLTYDKLQELSARLKIRMSDLFVEDDAAPSVPAVTARRSIGTRDSAFRVQTDNYDYYYLCTELRRKRMIPNITVIRARSIDEFGELVHHEGEEFVYVLKGQVIVHSEFYDPVTLNEGQSIYIDSNMGHAYLAGPDCKEAVTIAVMSSAEDDQMDSLMSIHNNER
jgi:transcriptional regulator with XRE-family HTH domain